MPHWHNIAAKSFPPTHKAAASACNRCCVKVQSFLSFTEAAGDPIAILGGEERDWVPRSEGVHFLGGKPITQFWLTVFQENKTNQTL